MKLPRLSLTRSWQLTKISAFTLAIGFAPALSNAQTSFTTVPVTVGVDNPAPMASAASESCTINNMQAGIAGGNLTIASIPERGYATYFNPAGTDELNDPGCFFSDPYPFTIDNVQFNMLQAAGFGQPPGLGILEYEVRIREADVDGEGCTSPGAILFESTVQSVEIVTGTNFYPATIPVGIEVSEGFFAEIAAVSWSGSATAAPSMVLWDNTAASLPACRQYVILIDENTSEPFYQNFSAVFTTGGWNNMVINGTTADIAGDVDIAVTDISAPLVATQSLPVDVSATVTNEGTAETAAVEVILTANGTEVAVTSVNLAPGENTVVNFVYTPAVVGDVNLVVSTAHPNDIDETNNSSAMMITVEAPADPCIFNDDIESYTLGGISAQDDQWTPWGTGAALDAEVSDEFAQSGTQSVKVIGEDDMLYLLGNQTSGTWKITFSLYMPEGSGGYFNLQKTQTPGEEFAVEVPFVNDGTGSVAAGAADAATFDWDHDTWNLVEIVINLEADVANLHINGDLVHQWPWSWEANSTTPSMSSIGAINFYPAADDSPLMYVDDVSMCMHSNNGPCEAFELQFGEVVQGDNTGAMPYDVTLADQADCWAESTNEVHGDVWYTFVVPTDGNYLVTTDLEVLDNDDTQLLVFTSSDDTCEGDLTAIGCGEDINSSNYLSSAIVEDLVAGDLIYILVDGWDGTTGTFQIGVFGANPPVNNECFAAVDLNDLTGGTPGDIANSGTFTNVYGTNSEDIAGLDCWDSSGGGESAVQVSTWYSFTGDGNTYLISTNDCAGAEIDYVDDTQLGIYTGTCDDLTEVACNDDLPGGLEAGVEFPTEDGVEYTILMDTWGGAQGEFCISFENMGNPDNTTNPDKYGMTLFPNPATDIVRIQADENMTNVIVLNSVGQMVQRVDANTSSDVVLDVNNLAKGLYFVQVTIAGEIFTKKFTVQ